MVPSKNVVLKCDPQINSNWEIADSWEPLQGKC